MKFAKYLDSDAVPEWKKKYIAYKTLKKVIKSIAREIENGNEDRHTGLGTPQQDSDNDRSTLIKKAVLNVTCASDGTVVISPTAAPILSNNHLSSKRGSTDSGDLGTMDDFNVDYGSDTKSIDNSSVRMYAVKPELVFAGNEEASQSCCSVDDVSCFTENVTGLSPLQSRFLLILAAEAKKINQFYREQEYQAEVNLEKVKELMAVYIRDASDELGLSENEPPASLHASTRSLPPDSPSNTKNDVLDIPETTQPPKPSSPLHDNGLEALELDMKTATHVEELLKSHEPSVRISNAGNTDFASVTAVSSGDEVSRDKNTWVPKLLKKSWAAFRPKTRSTKEAVVLKRALQELYRTLELLKNYRILNFTGFVKILKKFDKAMHTKVQSQLHKYLEQLYFYASPKLTEMLEAIEDMYTQLSAGNQHFAKSELQIPVSIYNKETEWSLWHSGVFSGISLSLILLTLRYYVILIDSWTPAQRRVLDLFGAFGLPLLFSYCLIANIYVYRVYRINYIFIFELSPRQHISLSELMSWISHLGLIFSVTFYLSFQPIFEISSDACPMLCFVLMLAYLFNPLPILYRDSRYWFLVTMYRLITSGIRPVEFRDFFTGDAVNSMGYSIGRLQIFVCLYHLGFDSTCNTANWTITVLQTLPPLWRAIQCARQFRDSKFRNLVNLANFGKYLTSIITGLIYGAWRLAPAQTPWTYAWLASVCVYMVYNLWWDLYCDWGLLRIVPYFSFRQDKLPLAVKGASNPLSSPEYASSSQQVIRGVTFNDLHSLVTTNHGALFEHSQLRSRANSKRDLYTNAENSKHDGSNENQTATRSSLALTTSNFGGRSSSRLSPYFQVNGPLNNTDLSLWGRFKFRLIVWQKQLNQKKYFLRANLAYPSIWIYYAAMTLDIVMRLQWLLPYFFYKGNYGLISVYLMALIEILRRSMWNFFRMENEHLNNCGRFRAVRDIPLLLDDWKYTNSNKNSESNNANNILSSVLDHPNSERKKPFWALFKSKAHEASEHELQDSNHFRINIKNN